MPEFATGGPIEGPENFRWELGEREQVIMPNGRIMCRRSLILRSMVSDYDGTEPQEFGPPR